MITPAQQAAGLKISAKLSIGVADLLETGPGADSFMISTKIADLIQSLAEFVEVDPNGASVFLQHMARGVVERARQVRP